VVTCILNLLQLPRAVILNCCAMYYILLALNLEVYVLQTCFTYISLCNVRGMTTHIIPYIKFLLNFTISYSGIQVRYLLIQPLVKVSMHFSQTAPITDGEASYELCSGRTGNAGKIQDIRVTATWKRYKQTA